MQSDGPIDPNIAALQRQFMSEVLPRVEKHAHVYFRNLRCKQRLADAVAEAVALCWRWFLRLAAKGKDVSGFISTLAVYAARAVRSGRRLAGQERANDVLSPRAQERKGFLVQTLPAHDTGTEDNAALDALRDSTKSPPPDAAAFRIDFPAWLLRQTERNRRIAHDLAMGERTKDVAGRYGTTQGRISQLRRAFMEDWRRFTGDAAV